jgi:hypothetical protein
MPNKPRTPKPKAAAPRLMSFARRQKKPKRQEELTLEPLAEKRYICDFVHEVLSDPAWDDDSTWHNKDRKTELALRKERNMLIKEKLQAGVSVAYKSSGNSLAPMVMSGDLCEFRPVTKDADVSLHDIVFCTVHPGQQFHAHIVRHKGWDEGRKSWYYHIGNASGYLNGCYWVDQIYGKLMTIARDY